MKKHMLKYIYNVFIAVYNLVIDNGVEWSTGGFWPQRGPGRRHGEFQAIKIASPRLP